MRKLALADEVAQSADSVWAVIGDFSGMKKWAPIVESESTEDTPQGPVRTLVLGGRTVKELRVDAGPHHYTYTLDRPDMRLYRSTVSVKPLAADRCLIELVVEFDPADGVDMTESTTNFLKFLGGNLKAMKRAAAA
ncbi:SRPBCC family protein [Caulobacter sp. KR2-114]|uniref:SRPBCC family protein n=1 Tax=Caulobacter sp. KR2-114 TaxID=3400912 RepID=UPI003C022F90